MVIRFTLRIASREFGRPEVRYEFLECNRQNGPNEEQTPCSGPWWLSPRGWRLAGRGSPPPLSLHKRTLLTPTPPALRAPPPPLGAGAVMAISKGKPCLNFCGHRPGKKGNGRFSSRCCSCAVPGRAGRSSGSCRISSLGVPGRTRSAAGTCRGRLCSGHVPGVP